MDIKSRTKAMKLAAGFSGIWHPHAPFCCFFFHFDAADSMFNGCSSATRNKIQYSCLVGVQSAAVEGEDMDQIVVTGDGVDSIALTKRLRKGMGRAILVSVAAVEESEEKLEPEPEAPSYVYCINEKGHYDEPHCIIL